MAACSREGPSDILQRLLKKDVLSFRSNPGTYCPPASVAVGHLKPPHGAKCRRTSSASLDLWRAGPKSRCEHLLCRVLCGQPRCPNMEPTFTRAPVGGPQNIAQVPMIIFELRRQNGLHGTVDVLSYDARWSALTRIARIVLQQEVESGGMLGILPEQKVGGKVPYDPAFQRDPVPRDRLAA